ncbi:hypothetical protein AcV5_000044 [Taiwanofungus camphoratus]|nr:hypothetical protein AcV5_000044 [Antrodia cinnamomea]
MEQCRKIQFANYFSTSSHLSISSWTTQDKDALADCGHCDNCTRTQDSFVRKDVSVAAWQLLRVADAVHHKDGRVTIGQLVDLARGGSGGTFGVGGGKKGRGRIKEKIDLGLEEVAGGKVDLSKEDTESLCVYLLLNHYLKESFVQTAYSINVYVIPGPSAMRLTRLTREDVEQGKGPMLQCCFPIKAARKATSTKKPSHEGTGLEGRGRGNGNTSKRKKPVVLNAPEDIDDNNTSYGETLAAIVDDHSTFEDDDVSKEDEDEDLDHEWNFSLRETVPAKRKPRTTGTRIKRPRHAPEASDGSFTGDQEVISISSD